MKNSNNNNRTGAENHAHVMTLMSTHPSGAEEWQCPTCGRRFVMQWPPRYKRIVLKAGDEMVRHTASKGCLRFTGFEVTPPSVLGNTSVKDEDDNPASLNVWSDWLDQLNFDDGDDASPATHQ